MIYNKLYGIDTKIENYIEKIDLDLEDKLKN